MRRKKLLLPAAALLLLYLMALLAPFLAPYSHTTQFRTFFYLPPARLHFVDRQGEWHGRPFVYAWEPVADPARYVESDRRLPLYFFVKGERYLWLGLSFDRHLFGVADADQPLGLLGTDALGRDLLSRILYGARFSLAAGTLAVVLTMLLGLVLGTVAGYFAGWSERVVMRVADLFLALPALFLLMGLRAVFPLRLSVEETYWLIVFLFMLVGWAPVARIIRGQILELKSQEYVLAARVSGASHGRILIHHILPFTSNYLLVQTAVLLPSFILGEVSLSFLGLGIQQPDASWGNLLADAYTLRVMTGYPWLLAPAFFIFLTVFAFNLLADQIKAPDPGSRPLW